LTRGCVEDLAVGLVATIERRVHVDQPGDSLRVARAEDVHFFSGERAADHHGLPDGDGVHDAHDILGQSRNVVAPRGRR
jgi:hypothetical protein